MSTVNPGNINTTRPPDGSGDPLNPVNYTSAEERGNRVDIQTEFQHAEDDINALESGLSAHTGAGNPHNNSASLGANTFDGNQNVEPSTGSATITVDSSNAGASVILEPGDGTPNQRAFGIAASMDTFIVAQYNDSGGLLGQALQIDWATSELGVAGNQTVAPAAGSAFHKVVSADSAAAVIMQPGDGTQNQQSFGIAASGGDFVIAQYDDTGNLLGQALQIDWATSQLNLAGNQTIAPGAGAAFHSVISADSSASIFLEPGDGIADQRTFGLVATAGDLVFAKYDDSGTLLQTAAKLNWATSNFDVQGEIQEQGARVFSPNNRQSAIVNTELADVAPFTFKGRATGGTGSPEDIGRTDLTIEGAAGGMYVPAWNILGTLIRVDLNDLLSGGALPSIAQHSMYARISASTGPGEEMVINSLTNNTGPVGTESLLAMNALGALERVQVSNLPTGGGGEVNTGANVGGSPGEFFRDKTGAVLNFRTLLGGDGKVTVATGADVVNLGINEPNVDHDNLGGYLSQEHVNHTGVVLTAGSGLTGGGDITAGRTFNVGAGDGISVAADSVAVNTTVVRTTRTVDTPNGSGLTGGGALSGNLSLAVDVDGNNGLEVLGSNKLSTKPAHSLIADITGIRFQGDVLSPGTNQVYGTDGAGARGWKPDPAGGTPSPLTTKGDVWTYDTGDTRLPVGNNGEVLVANSATATGLEWQTPAGGGNVTISGTTTVNSIMVGGAGATEIQDGPADVTLVNGANRVLNIGELTSTGASATLWSSSNGVVGGTMFSGATGSNDIGSQLVNAANLTELRPINDAGAEVAGRGQLVMQHSDGSFVIESNGTPATHQGSGTLSVAGGVFRDTLPYYAAGEQIAVNRGWGATARQYDNSAGTPHSFTPDPTVVGNVVQLSSTNQTDVELMPVEGTVVTFWPDSAQVGTTGWTLRGTQPSGIGRLDLVRMGATYMAYWS